MGTKETVQKLEKALKKDITSIVEDVKVIVADAAEAYKELKGGVDTKELGQVVASVIVPQLPLPWYVPAFVAEMVIANAVTKAADKVTKK